MTFSHEKALAGEPVWCGGMPMHELIKWYPAQAQWEYMGFDGQMLWDKNGKPKRQKFISHPPLTTTDPGKSLSGSDEK